MNSLVWLCFGVCTAALVDCATLRRAMVEQPIISFDPAKTSQDQGASEYADDANWMRDPSGNATMPNRPPEYRASWEDCGGVGASKTEKMRQISAAVNGFAPSMPFRKNAAQDCGKVDASSPTGGKHPTVDAIGPEGVPPANPSEE
ncbi:unnamed protein product [Vitrella brassicaformis CCMP3155]|uniref:Uncharacterized protein n=1 Tax=Vitrella brassicaformis (strain CCMP3155) TaxID=1169540 RepID=A0A0G4EJ29_VITBC|nr:unnamed protein product [Vitrella brassicaformis CCMP3155]|eukprot:CEL95914.1 unnamed protein product [Vitrella brassicaformis CCMP3155]